MPATTSTTAASSTSAPSSLEVPYDDHWYLIVDSYAHRIKVEFTQIFD